METDLVDITAAAVERFFETIIYFVSFSPFGMMILKKQPF